MLAVTFTRKAAGELVDRVGALGVEGVTAGTFHALALAQLRRRALEQHRPVPTVLASKARILGSLARDRGAGPVNAATLSDLAAEIEWAKARLVRPEQYATAARGRAAAAPPVRRRRRHLRPLRRREADQTHLAVRPPERSKMT